MYHLLLTQVYGFDLSTSSSCSVPAQLLVYSSSASLGSASTVSSAYRCLVIIRFALCLRLIIIACPLHKLFSLACEILQNLTLPSTS